MDHQAQEQHHAVPPADSKERGRSWLRKHRAAVVVITVFVVLIILATTLSIFLQPEPIPLVGPSVNLTYAQYIGRDLGNGVNAFLGMRYAAAPVGDLRWRAPVEPAATEVVQPALKFQSTCLGNGTQNPSLAAQDEDCLFVNVWSPSYTPLGAKLPVWVFIQGGGYSYNSMANYDGSEVVKQSGLKIVMVNFNYRVGIFGFLASQKVKKNGDLNVGLLDQRLLLYWVKQHIAKFGGDPDHVVIHGASAGAGSVAMHMTAYGGRDDGLFIGAISESLFFPAQPYLNELEWQFEEVVTKLGCDLQSYSTSEGDQMACLRSKDMLALQALNIPSPFPGRSSDIPLFFWSPCVDGELIRDLPYKLFQTGRFIMVPTMFGTCTDEGSTFVPKSASSPADMATFFFDNFPTLAPADIGSVLSYYPQIPPITTSPATGSWYPTLSKAYGDSTFICPTINLLRYINAHSPTTPTFAYRYNVQDPTNTLMGLGVPHVYDAAAIFGPDRLGVAVSSSYLSTGANAGIVPVLMGYYISFVRALDPGVYRDGRIAPVWDGWQGGRRLKVQTGDVGMEAVGREEMEVCAFWEGLAVPMRQR